MNLDNLEKKIIYHKPLLSNMDFVFVNYDLFLITSSMTVFNPNKHMVSRLEFTNGDSKLHYKISFKRSLDPSNRIFESIYFIRFREIDVTKKRGVLNEIKIKKIIISGWSGKTNWLLPF